MLKHVAHIVTTIFQIVKLKYEELAARILCLPIRALIVKIQVFPTKAIYSNTNYLQLKGYNYMFRPILGYQQVLYINMCKERRI
jgi:hypothetical protein